MYDMRPGSGLANWLEFVLLTHPTALLAVGTRAYEVRRIAPHLTRGAIGMKKPSTQIIGIMDGLAQDTDSGMFQLAPDQRAEVIRLCKDVDKRDQQYRKGKVPKPSASKAAKKKARR